MAGSVVVPDLEMTIVAIEYSFTASSSSWV